MKSYYERLSPEKRSEYREKKRIYWHEYKKRFTKEDLNKKIASNVRKWRTKFPKRRAAQVAVFVEVRAGRMRKGICFCGDINTEAHHPNYNKPLEVMWLCKRHHRMADRKELIAL